MEKMLKDHVVVVSGGTKGVGRGIVVEAARQGARVVFGGRDSEAGDRILSEINALGGEGMFVYTDLSKVEDCQKLFDDAVKEYGHIDGFVNYAGILPASTLEECSPEQFDSTFSVNIRAAFFCSQSAVKYMKQNGGGSIVMFGSPHAWCGEKDRPAYACSKGALYTLSEHIAHHYACDQIRCNFVTMGWVPTDGELTFRTSQGMDNEQLHEFAKGFIPMGRMQEVEDHVPGVIYLLSQYSSQVTGSNLRVTGGFYIG